MSDKEIQCYIIPSVPMPLLLPLECIAEIVAKPAVEPLNDAAESWMKGHVNWRNQHLPVISFSSLHDSSIDESFEKKPHLVVLNPIAKSSRKKYSGLLCYGDIEQVVVDRNLNYAHLDGDIDLTYIDGIVSLNKKDLIVPKLGALGDQYTKF